MKVDAMVYMYKHHPELHYDDLEIIFEDLKYDEDY